MAGSQLSSLLSGEIPRVGQKREVSVVTFISYEMLYIYIYTYNLYIYIYRCISYIYMYIYVKSLDNNGQCRRGAAAPIAQVNKAAQSRGWTPRLCRLRSAPWRVAFGVAGRFDVVSSSL